MGFLSSQSFSLLFCLLVLLGFAFFQTIFLLLVSWPNSLIKEPIYSFRMVPQTTQRHSLFFFFFFSGFSFSSSSPLYRRGQLCGTGNTPPGPPKSRLVRKATFLFFLPLRSVLRLPPFLVLDQTEAQVTSAPNVPCSASC
jgi:hypothetical protein